MKDDGPEWNALRRCQEVQDIAKADLDRALRNWQHAIIATTQAVTAWEGAKHG